jgi:predicted membrane-bound dolichyl-phosphate-mannose-protein mannosyltransferase
LRPEFFSDASARVVPRTILIFALSVLVIAGFALRVHNLASEGLSEDELNKLNAVGDYRAHGLTSANGEHPLLMKALLTVSVIGAERWNQTSLVAAHPELNLPVEMSLRLPSALFGAATAVLIFLIASELFGLEIGLLSAALWAFDPLTIGLNRIAKEDTFLVFFFLLAIFFWLRGQRVAESQPQRNPERYYWATAVALGAMMASKLIPILISIPVAYNYVFQNIPATRWVIGKKRFIKFFIILGVTFVVLSPTILLPGTWKAMANFTSYRAMGHDSYEFMGRLYTHKFADWLSGQPWYFYVVLLATKLPVVSLAGFAGGLALLFRRQTGDGRYLLLMWLALWTIAFVFVGGKFMRYITSLMPVVMISSAIGIQFVARKFGGLCARLTGNDSVKVYARAVLPSLVILATFWSATKASPHYRLYVNSPAGGATKAGAYFPQDEFYDAYMQDALREIAKRAQPRAVVVSELDSVSAYYAQRSNRADLVSLELSEPATVSRLRAGDFLIDARGRTYLSNQAMLLRLRAVSRPAFTISVGTIPAADVYVLDQKSLAALLGK